MAGRALASSQLEVEVDPTDLPECLHQPGPAEALIWEENGRSAVVPTCLVSIWHFLHYNEAEDTVFCFTCRKMLKERKNKTSTKADPVFVSSSL